MSNIHQEFIKELIKHPIETYIKVAREFKNKNYLMNEFEELWPIVDDLLHQISTDRILNICKEDLGLALMRKLAIQDLRHVAIPGVAVMPYGETVRSIAKALEFFDVCVRFENLKGRVLDMDKFVIEEENPRERDFAYYHRYRYLYYYYWLVDKIPEVFLLPTSVEVSADDLMRFRCVPVFILGVSTKLIYVDEFEQTPIEFFMHDMNHARRQYLANLKYFHEHNYDTDDLKMSFYKASYEFSNKTLNALLPSETDNSEEKAMKDIKRIILFEVTHEDAEPFMPDIVSMSLQRMEGFESRFEVPVLDPSTGLMNVKHTKETGISTLAYVRHKLQNGFYDRIGSEDFHIVEKEYRTTKMIAQAAYELLASIGAKAEPGVPVDEKGNVSEEYLLERACSYGPEIVHEAVIVDPDLEEKNKGIREVNIKNYFAYQKGEAEKMERVISQIAKHPKELADIRVTADIILTHKGQVYLPKRAMPPFLEKPAIPGGFLWERETGKESAGRVLRDKLGLSTDGLEFCTTVDDTQRDPRGRVISLVYKKEISEAEYKKLPTENFYSLDNLPELAFDHKEVIERILKGL